MSALRLSLAHPAHSVFLHRVAVQSVRPMATEAQYKWKIPPSKQTSTSWPEQAAKVRKWKKAVVFENKSNVKVINLVQSRKGNPLSAFLIDSISKELTKCDKAYDRTRLLVLINSVKEGVDPVFCSGDADVVRKSTNPEAYYRSQYTLFDKLHNTWPVISIVDGLAVDAGAGLALSTRFTLATNTSALTIRSQDSHYINGGVLAALADKDQALITYLALTGETVYGADLFYAGLANLYVPYECLPRLSNRLSELVSFEPRHINASLCEFMRLPTDQLSFQENMDTIRRCFQVPAMKGNLDLVLSALDKEPNDNVFACDTAEKLHKQPKENLETVFDQLKNLPKKELRQQILKNAFQAAFGKNELELMKVELVLPTPIPWAARQMVQVHSANDLATQAMIGQYQPEASEPKKIEPSQSESTTRNSVELQDDRSYPALGIIQEGAVSQLLSKDLHKKLSEWAIDHPRKRKSA